MLAAPEQVTSHWLGDAHARHRPCATSRIRSARAISCSARSGCSTLGDPRVGSQVLVACAVADSADALATVAARAQLPRVGVIGTVAVAGGAAVAGFYLSQRLAHA